MVDCEGRFGWFDERARLVTGYRAVNNTIVCDPHNNPTTQYSILISHASRSLAIKL